MGVHRKLFWGGAKIKTPGEENISLADAQIHNTLESNIFEYKIRKIRNNKEKNS